MSIRRFRRPRRWRDILAGIALMAIMFRPSTDRDDWLDPHATIVHGGEYKLTHVRDDGLLVIEVGSQTGETERVCFKLLGIEVEDPQKCAAAIRGLARDVVRLRFDRRRIDERGRLQAYAFIDEVLLNEELVRRGFAREDTHAADFGPIVRRIKQAEQAAKTERIGVWNAFSRRSD